MAGKIIGIDLGTTNSCVAIVDGGEPLVIPNSEGSRTTPSVVAFTEEGDRLVEQIAKRQAVTNHEITLYAIKRLIGRRFDEAEIQKASEVSPFPFVSADNGDAWVRAGENEMSPAQVSGIILEQIKQVAEDYLGQPETRAIITDPAHITDAQRQATNAASSPQSWMPWRWPATASWAR